MYNSNVYLMVILFYFILFYFSFNGVWTLPHIWEAVLCTEGIILQVAQAQGLH